MQDGADEPMHKIQRYLLLDQISDLVDYMYRLSERLTEGQYSQCVLGPLIAHSSVFVLHKELVPSFRSAAILQLAMLAHHLHLFGERENRENTLKHIKHLIACSQANSKTAK